MSRAHGCAGTTQLKTPYRDGTTHVIFEPLGFIARLAALVPNAGGPYRFHGVFVPNSKFRAAMTWVQHRRRVFRIDIETCPICAGAVRIIACIEDPDVIAKILAHLDAKGAEPQAPEAAALADDR